MYTYMSVSFLARKEAHKHELFGLAAFGTILGLSQGQTQYSLGQTKVFSLFPQRKPNSSP